MTEPAVLPVADLTPESFWAVVFRRTRYVVAVILAAVLFYWIGWMVAAPPADMAGVSLMAGATSNIWLSTIVLGVLLLIATGVSTVLVHPDTPHMGLCCALMGLAGLSIRGGDNHMLVSQAEWVKNYKGMSQLLAMECFQWGIIFLLAEFVARWLHDNFLTNTRWLTRSGVDLTRSLPRVGGSGVALGMAVGVAKAIGTLKLPRPVAIPLTFVLNGLLGSFFLYLFLQSGTKGQVLFACFAAFLISTHIAYYAFPRVPPLVFFLTVPVTAAAGFMLSGNYLPKYPGHAELFFGRALPIDYICAGIPGAIFGYYLAFHWDLHSRSEPAAV